ncbi:hypothetical protein F4805DRAFT_460882 [Annulohypoxylon moriforme]|nr:hypothetical protein F4805DRAFT_460882 [Annulohypoxylon moriforme]
MPPYAFFNPFPYGSCTDDSPQAKMKRKILGTLVILFGCITVISASLYLSRYQYQDMKAALVIMYCFTVSSIFSSFLWLCIECKVRRRRRQAKRAAAAARSRQADRDVEGQPIELQNLGNTPQDGSDAAQATPQAPQKAHVVDGEEELQSVAIE